MMLVFDSSVAVKWVLPEPDSEAALAIRDTARASAIQIIAPDVFASEVAHALTKAERQAIIPTGDASVHLFDILQNGPVLFSFLPQLPRAVEISSQVRIAVTDCLFVALAEREHCPLLTADRRLIQNLERFPLIPIEVL